MFFLLFHPVCPFLEQVQEQVALLAGLEAGRTSFLLFFFFFCPVFMGPVLLVSALQLGRLSRDSLQGRRLTSWQPRQWQRVSLRSFPPFCFRTQDSLLVYLGCSEGLFTDPQRCQVHVLKTTGQVYVPETAPPHRGPLMSGPGGGAALIAACSVCQKNGC